jgi:hypothetical protein
MHISTFPLIKSDDLGEDRTPRLPGMTPLSCLEVAQENVSDPELHLPDSGRNLKRNHDPAFKIPVPRKGTLADPVKLFPRDARIVALMEGPYERSSVLLLSASDRTAVSNRKDVRPSPLMEHGREKESPLLFCRRRIRVPGGPFRCLVEDITAGPCLFSPGTGRRDEVKATSFQSNLISMKKGFTVGPSPGTSGYPLVIPVPCRVRKCLKNRYCPPHEV